MYLLPASDCPREPFQDTTGSASQRRTPQSLTGVILRPRSMVPRSTATGPGPPAKAWNHEVALLQGVLPMSRSGELVRH